MNEPDSFNLKGWGHDKRLIEGYCAHCKRAVVFEAPTGEASLYFQQAVSVEDQVEEVFEHFFVMGICPRIACRKATIVYRVERYMLVAGRDSDHEVTREEIIHPVNSARRELPDEVPSEIRDVFDEAARIEFHSPTGAAFLAGRILEQTLRARLRDAAPLAKLIDMFLEREHLPTELHSLMHDVRELRNIAGHPSESGDGSWIKVDQEEASYVLGVVEQLLDYVFVRPIVQGRMREGFFAKKRGEVTSRPSTPSILLGGRDRPAAKKGPFDAAHDDLPF